VITSLEVLIIFKFIISFILTYSPKI